MKGLGTALITPFCDNGSIDYSALAHLIEHQVAGGVDYLVILGTTSEAPTLSIEEQEQVIAFVVKQVAGRVPLVLGVGGNDTAALVARIQTLSPILQQHFAAILSVTPYYNRPPQEGLYQHFCAVATASPIPILLYNVPKRTGVNLLPETTRRIYDAHPDKIMGIKEACNSVEQFTETVKIANGDFAVISGDDDLAYEMMRAGGDGLISVASNAWPAAMRQLIHEQSPLIQQQYAHLIHLLFVEGNPGGIKTVLSEMGLIKNVLRLPLVANTPNHQMVIRKALQYHIEKEQD
jgi:4-hydroxy-tetrahydrodipicolinate synthase